jgi:hypothetical protein
MKRHVIEVQFAIYESKRPEDVIGLLRQVMDAANSEMPYAYRLDMSDNDYALVSTKARNSSGAFEHAVPLLDSRVSIAPATRTIAQHAHLMANELSKQTGMHVGCCQGFVPETGIP